MKKSNFFINAILCRCPECHQGKLFASPLKIAPQCAHCGCDFSFENSGDGAAAFLIFIIGGLAVALTAYTELHFSPPFWVDFMVFVSIEIIGLGLLLQSAKSLMIHLQYKNSQ